MLANQQGIAIGACQQNTCRARGGWVRFALPMQPFCFEPLLYLAHLIKGQLFRPPPNARQNLICIPKRNFFIFVL